MNVNTTTVPPEHIAVIAATVAEILGDAARVVSITPVAAPHLVSTRSAWIVEGRAALMGSHRPHIHGGGSARWR